MNDAKLKNLAVRLLDSEDGISEDAYTALLDCLPEPIALELNRRVEVGVSNNRTTGQQDNRTTDMTQPVEDLMPDWMLPVDQYQEAMDHELNAEYDRWEGWGDPDPNATDGAFYLPEDHDLGEWRIDGE